MVHLLLRRKILDLAVLHARLIAVGFAIGLNWDDAIFSAAQGELFILCVHGVVEGCVAGGAAGRIRLCTLVIRL